MKGWRFYEEFKSPRRKVPIGNVVALDTIQKPHPLNADGHFQWQHGCISAVYYQPNSPVVYDSVALYYVRRYCKRISEAKAREIHPKLFEYLEEEQ